MDFREFLKNNIVFLDGATGTILQESGLPSGEKPEKWGVTHPAVLQKVHQSYYDSGSNVSTSIGKRISRSRDVKRFGYRRKKKPFLSPKP